MFLRIDFGRRNPVHVIDSITPVTASHRGTCAIYLCHQPTSQLHTLVPNGSVRERERERERRLRAQIDLSRKSE